MEAAFVVTSRWPFPGHRYRLPARHYSCREGSGSRLSYTATVKVKVPLVGGKIENFMCGPNRRRDHQAAGLHERVDRPKRLKQNGRAGTRLQPDDRAGRCGSHATGCGGCGPSAVRREGSRSGWRRPRRWRREARWPCRYRYEVGSRSNVSSAISPGTSGCASPRLNVRYGTGCRVRGHGVADPTMDGTQLSLGDISHAAALIDILEIDEERPVARGGIQE